jgi:hypothetical protein
MIRLGLTLRSNRDPRHIWVVLSNPDQTGGEILFVNFTSWCPGRDDHPTIFTKADYWLLSHESVIAFWGCRNAAAAPKLKSAIDRGYFAVVPDVPKQTLQKMILAARVSYDLSVAQKRLIPGSL